MQILTWTSQDPEMPETARAVARIRTFIPSTKRGGGSVEWLPTSFMARTEQEARAKAQAFWDAELAKMRAKKPRGGKKPPVDPIGDVI